jgi:hypothetical protein
VPIRDAVLALWRENAAPAAQLAAVDDRRHELVAGNERARDAGPRGSGAPETRLGAGAGSITVTVPLRITVDLGPVLPGHKDDGGR